MRIPRIALNRIEAFNVLPFQSVMILTNVRMEFWSEPQFERFRRAVAVLYLRVLIDSGIGRPQHRVTPVAVVAVLDDRLGIRGDPVNPMLSLGR